VFGMLTGTMWSVRAGVIYNQAADHGMSANRERLPAIERRQQSRAINQIAEGRTDGGSDNSGGRKHGSTPRFDVAVTRMCDRVQARVACRGERTGPYRDRWVGSAPELAEAT
jgi:hypothetical protein